MEMAKLKYELLYIPMPALEFTCQFNPETLVINKSVSWKGDVTPGRDFPITNYAGGQSATYSLELYFDTAFGLYDKGQHKIDDIRIVTNKIMALTLRAGGYSVGGAQNPYLMVPPTVYFVWGSMQLFRAVATKVQVSYVLFTQGGIPIRAKCVMEFMERSHPLDLLPPQNPSSRTDARRTHRVVAGDRLDNIAHNEFADPRRWRNIAEANNIDDPFTLRDGNLLSIPNID